MSDNPTTTKVSKGRSKNSEFKKQKTMEDQSDSPSKTVIVQGFPADTSADENSTDLRTTERKLELLFSMYGAVEVCDVHTQWSDSFARVTFANKSSAVKAHAAAANREVRMDELILTVTLLIGDKAPIGKLNDHCLMKVFSLLENQDKLNLEKVCKRWRDVARISWYSVKHLDGTVNLPTFKDCILRCGRYLDNLSFFAKPPSSLSLVNQHCTNVKNLTIFDFSSSDLDKLCSLLEKLRKLKRFALYISNDVSRDFVASLPESMEEIVILPNLPMRNCGLCSQDFSKFHDLQKLVVSGIVLGNATINGLQTLTNLTHLDINGGGNNTTTVMQIQHLSNLKFLAIAHYPINDDTLRDIVTSNRGLEVVDISYISAITDESLRAVSLLVNLKSLKMKNLPNAALARVDAMPRLEYLNCSDCRNVGEDQLLTIISSSPVLAYLNIVSCSVTNEFFAAAAMSTKNRDNSIALRIVSDRHVSLSKQYPLLIIERDNLRDEYLIRDYYSGSSSEDSGTESVDSGDGMNYSSPNEWFNERFNGYETDDCDNDGEDDDNDSNNSNNSDNDDSEPNSNSNSESSLLEESNSSDPSTNYSSSSSSQASSGRNNSVDCTDAQSERSSSTSESFSAAESVGSDTAEHSESRSSDESIKSNRVDDSSGGDGFAASDKSTESANDDNDDDDDDNDSVVCDESIESNDTHDDEDLEVSNESADSNNSNDDDGHEDSDVSNESAASNNVDDDDDGDDGSDKESVSSHESSGSDDVDVCDENSDASNQSNGSDNADENDEQSASDSSPGSDRDDDSDGPDSPHASDDDYSDY